MTIKAKAPEPVVRELVRMPPHVYAKLEEKCIISMTGEVTPLMAGFMLGQQKVLKTLREGFLV